MIARKILYLLCICLWPCNFLAQTSSSVDSLKAALRFSPNGPDKFRTYGQISWHYINTSQLQQAEDYADSLKVYAENLNDLSGIAYAQFYYGVVARYKGEYSKALDHLEAFTTYYASIGDSTRVAHGLFQMGSVYDNIGDYEKSIAVLYRALKIHEQEKDQSSINEALNNIAIVLKAAKQYDESFKMFQKVLLTDSLNTDVLMNLGNLYREIGEFKEAENHYLKALKIDEENDNMRFVAFDLENLGNLFIKMQAYDKALGYGTRALQIRLGLPYKLEETYSLKQLGLIYLKMNDHLTAKDYLMQAEQVALGINAKKELKDIYKNLALAHSKNRNHQKAFEYQKYYSELNDSLLNKDAHRLINETKTKYETEKKDQEITLLAQQKQLQEKETQRQATLKNTFIGGVLLIALWAALLFYTFRQRLKNQKSLAAKNQEIKEVNFKQQLTELEMKALQAHINPHFIFNCMNSINEMILDGKNVNASKYLTKFAKLIRTILENAQETEVSLKNELELLEAYIQLEALRFQGKIEYRINVADSLDTMNTYLPSMVLQPFVENAVWHGLQHKKETNNGHITISVDQEEEQLICVIEDNGVGRKKAFELQQKAVRKSQSLGLKITEDRLKILSKEFQKQLINIIDLKDKTGRASGTRVIVNIPIG